MRGYNGSMKYIEIGKTGIKVSRLCVGGMSFGEPSEDFHLWTLEQEATTEMVAHALDMGVNFIDTANCYSHGTSEQYIGRTLRELGVSRDKVVIASKVYFNEGMLSRQAILREIEGTLRRLGTDYLDLYYIHRFDYSTPIEETMEALHSLVTAGKVRALGASAMYGYQFHNMQLAAERNGWTLFSAMQNHYNLLYREDERELIPICQQYGVSLIPYSPLAGGHLSRREWDVDTARSKTDRVLHAKYDPMQQADRGIVARVAEIAERREVPMSAVALAWHFARGVAAPIVGATNASHFDDAIKALDLQLTTEERDFLEELYTPHPITGARPPHQ